MVVAAASGWYGVKYMILPILANGTGCIAGIMRMTRLSMLEVVRAGLHPHEPRKAGQSESKPSWKHALPQCAGSGHHGHRHPDLAAFWLAAVLVETVFAIPGLPKYIVDSVNFKIILIVQGGVLWIGLNCIVIT